VESQLTPVVGTLIETILKEGKLHINPPTHMELNLTQLKVIGAKNLSMRISEEEFGTKRIYI
jgi:hypothetical protein